MLQPAPQTLPTNTAEDYLQLSLSKNTRKAYKNDLAHFTAWGGSVPCTPDTLVSYLVAYAGKLSIATLIRRIASISKAHTMQGIQSPASFDLVKMTMRGIKRQHGKPQYQVSPLVKEDIIVILSAIQDDLRGYRDKAVLIIGFCAALRRSELCQIRYEDIEFTHEGLVLTLPRSKTDQTGQGRRIGIPFGKGRVCPVSILQDWLSRSGIVEKYIFRAVEKGKVAGQRLSDRSIANIIKARTRKAGYDPARYSGHSLRSGLATSAAQHGFSSWEIRRQTGHKSDAMLSRYIREGSLFRGNAGGLF